MIRGIDVLALPMDRNDADAKTVKDYLITLLTTLWIDQESFSGKRPFGNSGWDYDLYKPLIKGGLVEGEPVDEGKAFKLILKAIEAL